MPTARSDRSAWLALGGIGMDDVIVDTSTGVVYCVPEERSVHVLNSSVDALGFFLHASCTRRKGNGTLTTATSTRTRASTPWARKNACALMHSTDSVALENPDSSWHMVLHHVGNGLMFH